MAQFNSNSRGHPVLWSVLVVLLFLVYLLVFPKRLGPEFSLVPTSAQRLQTAQGPVTPSSGFLFKLGDSYGVAEASGAIKYLLPPGPQMALGPGKYAQVNLEKKELEVWKPGQKIFSLPGYAYPYWSGDRLFTLDANLFGVGEISGGGQLLWYRNYASLVTSVSAGKTLTAVGLLTGLVEILDTQGKIKGQYMPTASKHQVVYSTAMAPDDSRVAVVCGAGPKRFVLLDKNAAGDFQSVATRELKDDSTNPTPLGFLASGELVYYYDGLGLSIMNTKTFEEKAIKFSGSLEWVDFDAKEKLLLLVTRDQGNTFMSISSLDGGVLSRVQFPAQDFFIRHDKKDLFMGLGGTLLKLEEKQL